MNSTTRDTNHVLLKTNESIMKLNRNQEIPPDKGKWKPITSKIYGWAKQFYEKFKENSTLSRKTRKLNDKSKPSYLKEIPSLKTRKPKVSRRKEITTIREENK